MILDASYTLLVACIALLIGMFVVKFTPFLQKNHIPEAVVGGFIVAIVLLIIDKTSGYSFTFDASLQSLLMLTFFSSIGLSSDFSRLIKGGKPLVLLTIAVTILIAIQNTVGMSMAVMMNESPFIGLIAGSITLTGGHGNAGAWGPILADKYGVTGAVELAMACATLGLVLGGLVGGPVARHLLKKVSIPKTTEQERDTIVEAFEQPSVKRKINANNVIETISMLIICIVVGGYISALFKDTFLQLPTFVWCLFVGIIIRNTLTHVFKHEVFEPTVDVLGSVALSLFLAMALMSLKFGQLASMAGPVLIIIAVQTVVMVLFACFITFKMMGKDYDAVVISAGHCGFGLRNPLMILIKIIRGFIRAQLLSELRIILYLILPFLEIDFCTTLFSSQKSCVISFTGNRTIPSSTDQSMGALCIRDKCSSKIDRITIAVPFQNILFVYITFGPESERNLIGIREKNLVRNGVVKRIISASVSLEPSSNLFIFTGVVPNAVQMKSPNCFKSINWDFLGFPVVLINRFSE